MGNNQLRVRWSAKPEIWELASQVGMHFLFEEGVIVNMKVVCPQDVKKMPKGPAKEVDGKKWATKHACEEFKKRECGKSH